MAETPSKTKQTKRHKVSRHMLGVVKNSIGLPFITSVKKIVHDNVVYFLLYIYRLFSLFLLFTVFTPLHEECFCARRRTQLCSLTTHRDI